MTTGNFDNVSAKHEVHRFWNAQSCGEVYGDLTEQERIRYELEPYILDFARFEDGAGRDVLEIGVGMGADHLKWAKENPRSLTGIDLTERAVEFTRRRLRDAGVAPNVEVSDAERLTFQDESFDIVYSWGVLHHTPDTEKAIREVYRVLRPGGTARIMVYHRPSLVGLMLWLRYGILRGRPFTSLKRIYAEHLESPGTKGFTTAEARRMFTQFSFVNISLTASTGDLLLGASGQRHGVPSSIRKLWPRWLIRRIPFFALNLMIEARK